MIVTCYDGSKAERKDVRRIKGDYYRHSDILMIDGTRFRCTNPTVVRDVRDGSLQSIHNLGSRLRKSIKIIKSARGNLLYEVQVGNSAEDTPEQVFLHMNGSIRSFNTSMEYLDVAKSVCGVGYDGGPDAYFIRVDGISDDQFEHLQEVVSEFQGAMYENLQYSMDRNSKFFENHSYKPTSNLRLESAMEGLTFGAEFETSGGKIPHKELLKLGVAPLRDGSISGYEYTTIPLSSINHLKDIIDTLNNRCTITYKDSLHFHIGGVPRSEAFVLKAFKLSQLLQDELYSMVPKYKLNDEHHIKRRDANYTNKLPAIDISKDGAMSRLVSFLSDGNESGGGIRTRPHPSDPSGDHKWQIRNRYTCINFVNYIYSPSGTIEFRLHAGTTNAYKAIYWLLINNAIVQAAMTLSISDIQGSKPTLDDILKSSYGVGIVSNALIIYINEMKDYYANYPSEDQYFEKDSAEDRAYKPIIKLW